ncbi:MAG TPA: hypothetical protein PKW60_13170, partial [Candidatus Hydrogenedentes bacterium]|nr:hypothetical protein [Candidatus Hydrogenedentota bacterium]
MITPLPTAYRIIGQNASSKLHILSILHDYMPLISGKSADPPHFPRNLAFGTQLVSLPVMKVAIPEWQGRISPVFDVAATLVVSNFAADGQAIEQHSIQLFRNDLHGRVMEMTGLGIDVLICGAISWPLEMALSNAGIEVIPHTCGEVQSVLESYKANRLQPNTFLMPGCCG